MQDQFLYEAIKARSDQLNEQGRLELIEENKRLHSINQQMLEALEECKAGVISEYSHRIWEMNFPKAEAAIQLAKGTPAK